MALSPIAVLGAGSWGTALAIHLARVHQDVRLWTRSQTQATNLQTTRVNETYLPSITLPESITVSASLETVLKNCSDILIVVPSHFFRDILLLIKPLIATSQTTPRIVWATKGLDPQGSLLLSMVAQEVLGDTIPVAVLSGPSFAIELAEGLPTAIALSSVDIAFRDSLLPRFHHHALRVYTNDDLIGSQLGGAIKNVLAIAAGISDGLGFGANARAGLITRGLAEMERLVIAMGGQTKTTMGLSGLGDLVLTCTDNKSRNRRFGLLIGQGVTIDAALAQIQQVVEGHITTQQLHALALRYHVDMPISTQVYRVLYEQLSPRKAVEALFAREAKDELH